MINWEINALSTLEHHNIIKLLGKSERVHSDEENCFIRELLFDYCDFDLQGMIYHPGWKCSDDLIKCIARQVLQGVEFIHKQGFIHCDVRPTNVLLNNRGVVKLTGFKYAQFRNGLGGVFAYVGKLEYRSPEVLCGSTKYSFSTDVWSAG